jgi:hypothetical protein
MIKGKTPEEIRKLFNIVNDFTPEEEVRRFRSNEILVLTRYLVQQAQIKKENVSDSFLNSSFGTYVFLLSGMGRGPIGTIPMLLFTSFLFLYHCRNHLTRNLHFCRYERSCTDLLLTVRLRTSRDWLSTLGNPTKSESVDSC